jgi:hypothetical protein
MKKIKLSLPFLSAAILRLVLVPSVQAVCPICTVAVVAGLGLSRYLGIDDTVSGVWIGGVILSTSLWLIDWLGKKNFKSLKWYYDFKYRYYAVIFLMYALVVLPLLRGEIIGHPFNKLWGIDKLILGIVVGSGAFLLGVYADKKVRGLKGKQLFGFQKVVFPVVTLLLASLIFFLITSVKIKLI